MIFQHYTIESQVYRKVTRDPIPLFFPPSTENSRLHTSHNIQRPKKH